MNTIYFDMDGTIANLYAVENWLEKLRVENPSPYKDAEPMVEVEEFQILLAILQNRGVRIGIVSWLAKDSSKSYDKLVRNAKKDWLREMFPEIQFDEMHFVKYGTRKDYIVKDKFGIIFDDDERVRDNWRGLPINPNTQDILEKLREIKKMTE